jgi:hypothetical protein
MLIYIHEQAEKGLQLAVADQVAQNRTHALLKSDLALVRERKEDISQRLTSARDGANSSYDTLLRPDTLKRAVKWPTVLESRLMRSRRRTL